MDHDRWMLLLTACGVGVAFVTCVVTVMIYVTA